MTFTSHVTCIALVGYSSTVFGFLIDYFIYYNCKYFDTYVYNSRDIKTNSDSLHCVTVFFFFLKEKIQRMVTFIPTIKFLTGLIWGT